MKKIKFIKKIYLNNFKSILRELLSLNAIIKIYHNKNYCNHGKNCVIFVVFKTMATAFKLNNCLMVHSY